MQFRLKTLLGLATVACVLIAVVLSIVKPRARVREHRLGFLRVDDQVSALDRPCRAVELKTKSVGDRLILAKTEPQANLAATIETVQRRAANPEPKKPLDGAVLKVPKMNFDITRRFTELEGRQLLHQNPHVARDLVVLSALQNIRYQFDERGVRLRSESHLSFGCAGAPGRDSTNHVMVFDKPFLVLLQRSDADVPYFALWVGNPELLVQVAG